VVRRRENPFAAKKARLPYKALLRREEPLRPTDRNELEAVTLSIAAGGEFLIYEGMRGDELGCRVIAFDAPEKALFPERLDEYLGEDNPVCPIITLRIFTQPGPKADVAEQFGPTRRKIQ